MISVNCLWQLRFTPDWAEILGECVFNVHGQESAGIPFAGTWFPCYDQNTKNSSNLRSNNNVSWEPATGNRNAIGVQSMSMKYIFSKKFQVNRVQIEATIWYLLKIPIYDLFLSSSIMGHNHSGKLKIGMHIYNHLPFSHIKAHSLPVPGF